MPKVIFQSNGLDASDDVCVETNNVMESLLSHFEGSLPDNTRIYHQQVCQSNDVTPSATCIEKDIDRLQSLEGDIYVVTHPQFFLFGLTGILGTLLKVFILGLISYLLRPKPPKERNRGEQSPNNGLSDRVNEARPSERIPDIYGQVVSTPDLIAKPYFRFEDNREIEYSYMCVGRGRYEITDVKDDITPIEDISGISYAIYGPGTSPNGGLAEFQYGTPINEPIRAARKSNAVNGQLLRPPNASTVNGENDIAFSSPDVVLTNNSDIDFEESFVQGDVFIIADSQTGDNATGPNLDGTYEVLSVSNNSVTLVNPSTVNAEWSNSFNTGFTDAVLRTTSDKWEGWFVVEKAYGLIANIIAPNGLYSDDGEKQYTFGVALELQAQKLDSNDNPVGSVTTWTGGVSGSATLQNARMNSFNVTLPGQTPSESKSSKWRVRMRRTTLRPERDEDNQRRYVDQVQWRDLYSMEFLFEDDFGDVTTIQVRTPATSGSLSIKQRKFNCKATRLISNNDGTQLIPSKDAGLILRSIATDPKLGNMDPSELDVASIIAAIQDNKTYFGTPLASKFNYTFDQKNTSAEEMMQAVARAVFCTAFRQGQLLKLHFERQTDLSVLQFNHRNKIPNSELRSVRFGNSEDNDGVDFEWVDPDDGAIQTFQIPTDGSANNPKKIEINGIMSEVQAHFHAWREFQKIVHRNVAVEFDATAEAITLTLNQKILVADNTRGDTWDGQITYQDGVTLFLSQMFEGVDGTDYTIHLQHYDGQVEPLEIVAFGENNVTVGMAPRLPLVIDNDKYANTTYIIVENNKKRPTAFLVQEVSPKDGMTVSLSAVNYDDRYYDHDKDFINGVIT